MRECAVVGHLSRNMPLGVIVALAGYTPRDVTTDPAAAALPFLAAVPVTVGLHLWRHTGLISILAVG